MLCLFGKCGGNSRNTLFGVVVIGVLAGIVGVRLLEGRPAQTPAVIQGAGLTLASALERGQAEGKPVLIFATAKWCAPCQVLKRGALSDERVQAFIDEKTVAITLEETTPEGRAALDEIGVYSFPTLVMAEGRTIVGVVDRVVSSDELLDWLERSAGPDEATTDAQGPGPDPENG